MGWKCKPKEEKKPLPSHDQVEGEPLNSLDEAVESVTAEAIESLRLIADATERTPEAFILVARELNPGAISRRALRSTDNVERVIFSSIDELMSPEEELQDWTTPATPHLKSGWLRKELEDDVRDLERSLRDLREASLSYGRFWASHAGLGGFVKNMVHGVQNPVDGWLGWVGKSSINTEQDRLVNDFADALSNVSNDCESIAEEIVMRSQLKFSEIRSSIFDTEN